MASLRNLSILGNISQKLTCLTIQNGKGVKNINLNNTCRTIATSKPLYDLMEFFDDKKNWGQMEVKSGRAWKVEELRIKSNTDLHKLWFVLLKERNMLLTMEEECKAQVRVFPSPERLDKVEESMENLEMVVRERNKAYYELETGETGERRGEVVEDALGLRRYHKYTEHLIPKYMNAKWRNREVRKVTKKELDEFLLKYKEKLYLNKRREKARNLNHVIGLLKRFPNMDMEAVKEQYPDVDIEKAKASRKCRGHFAPE